MFAEENHIKTSEREVQGNVCVGEWASLFESERP